MSSCKGPKRVFELEPSASCQQKASQSKTDQMEAKGQHQWTGLGSSRDDFEEFVALLDRIQYLKTNHANLGISNDISMPAEDLDAKVLKTKSPWIPSFEWEDFCISAVKDTVSAQMDICSPSRKENQSSSEEKGEQSFQSANHLKTPSFSRDAYDSGAAGFFDLNVEASS